MMMAPFYSGRAAGRWGPRGTNHLDTGAPWYDVYETADGKWLALGAVEPHFHAQLIAGLGLADDPDVAAQYDSAHWPAARVQIAATVRTRTRDDWVAVFDGTDACVAPVLDPVEATDHPHAKFRRSFVEVAGAPQPRPAPRFSETPLAEPQPGRPAATDTADALRAWGVDDERIAVLAGAGVVSP
jgi:alpha-methylacyl-CoA racemase